MHNDKLQKVTRRPKRHFSLEDKKNFCIAWEASGLDKAKFCKKYDLVHSVFSKWCRQLNSNKPTPPSQNHWIPIALNETPSLLKKDKGVIDIKIPNITHVLLFALCCIHLLRQGWCTRI